MITKTPLYYSVMESIRKSILTGQYPVGTLLPTENKLEALFNVSKITIRKAIELLEADGFVIKKSGHGTTIISNSLYNKLSKGESFSHILHEEGFNLRKKGTTFKKVTVDAISPHATYFGTKATKMERMYFMDDMPYIYMEHYFAADVKLPSEHELRDDNNFSLYMFLYQNGYTISHFEDSFTIGAVPLDVTKKLGIATNTPLLIRTRLSYDAKQEVVETSISYYDTTVHPYQINYQV